MTVEIGDLVYHAGRFCSVCHTYLYSGGYSSVSSNMLVDKRRYGVSYNVEPGGLTGVFAKKGLEKW